MAKRKQLKFRNEDDYPALRIQLGELKRGGAFKRFGVHAIGIGPKIKKGKTTDQLVIRFYVLCKLPEANLDPAMRIPGSFQTFVTTQQKTIELKTDVIVSAPAYTHAPGLDEVNRPVPGGVSCSSITFFGTGTIGGWVWDNTDNSIVMLSNYHVFGATIGGQIIQPGTADGGVFPQDQVARVKRSIPVKGYEGDPVPSDCNFIDAAIAASDNSEFFDLTVVEIGPAVYDTGNPVLGEIVEKTGQTTGHTVGIVVDADYSTIISGYPAGPAVFCDCIRIEPVDSALLFSSNGDSGSIVFRTNTESVLKPALGLYFGGGGTPPNNYGVACKIQTVFNELDLGPLCIAGCAAWVDALYADEADEGTQGAITDFAKPVKPSPSQHFHTGLTIDLQKRISSSQKGRGLLRFINKHRSELLPLVSVNGDVRRSLTAALRPMLKGAITTKDVLNYRLNKKDIKRLEKALDVWECHGSKTMAKSLKVIYRLIKDGENMTVEEVFGLGS